MFARLAFSRSSGIVIFMIRNRFPSCGRGRLGWPARREAASWKAEAPSAKSVERVKVAEKNTQPSEKVRSLTKWQGPDDAIRRGSGDSRERVLRLMAL
jgi:hypothetical protein